MAINVNVETLVSELGIGPLTVETEDIIKELGGSKKNV